MLSPITTTGPLLSATKAAQSHSAQAMRTAYVGSTRAEAGPSRVPPETTRAVEAARHVGLAQRLRDSETREGRTPSDDLPVGPPPAFRETYLERQARTALDPRETPPMGMETIAPWGSTRARTGFAEAMALSAPAAAPGLDTRE